MTEREKFRIETIVCYDEGDEYWENRRNREASAAGQPFPVSFISVRQELKGRIPFNEGTRVAYAYGADYIVRVNDDTEFVKPAWISAGVNMLMSLHPPNVGVVGPTCICVGELCSIANQEEILTHDMVHSSHLDIFNDYYPREFSNWWVDDWISKVYGISRTHRLKSWVIKHHTDTYGQRYHVDLEQLNLLPRLIAEGRDTVEQYVLALSLGRENEYRKTKFGSSSTGVFSSDSVKVTGGPLLALLRKDKRPSARL